MGNDNGLNNTTNRLTKVLREEMIGPNELLSFYELRDRLGRVVERMVYSISRTKPKGRKRQQPVYLS